ncbi:SpvB/TcaC N-terminal domain-containing protein [Pantoea sp. App145]|uniref:SpvB/TcaC N-terminal domain-containing protein n=1 Tax=Pantoea sp. App145 TaxID=3071567 RepID=UPI003A8103A0
MDNISVNEKVSAPSALALPKGGGAIQGMGQVLSPAGSRGLSELNFPLPLTPGRGYAPPLSLHYSSSDGNGVFGLGCHVSVMRVVRQTRYGVPQYTQDDTFLGPDGEELVAERDTTGKIIIRECESYGNQKLAGTYTVTRYFPSVEGSFHRIEHWALANDPGFWLIHDADGDLHCLGKDASARLADPANPQHVAEWWVQESLAPTGHQICYQYRSGCLSAALDKVFYGNVDATDRLAAWQNLSVDPGKWLFTVIFDYGERGTDFNKAPTYDAERNTAPLRKDPLVFYEYGFAREINVLCRQVLMFHRFKELNNGAPALISRFLPEYDESPMLTRLVSVRTVGYDQQGKALSMPPVDLEYTPFPTSLAVENWRPLEALVAIRDGQDYQLVDLYGEGLPGLLFRDGGGWYYRAPQRGEAENSIIYGPMQSLPVSPSFKRSEMALMDLNGDGKLDWIVQRPELAGYFTLGKDRHWSNFIPFHDWPSEFMSVHAQLADLLGAGLYDLALIGPKSVRLYINQREGFAAPQTVIQDPAITLPVAGRDVTELVAFSDVLGSGQQHLISVRHDSVTCWPNLGRGHFAAPRTLKGLTLDSNTFNPSQLYLADVDGSGAVDILYAEADRLLIFRNQSGQSFAAPLILPLPQGVHYDRLCQLSCVGLEGNGTTTLVLTVPHMAVQHWCYTFAEQKPYLLSGINSNMGIDIQLKYRSSAQAWLDEKKEHPEAECHLPFPVQLLSSIETRDEITGNLLTQRFNFRGGYYDGVMRELRGFRLVESRDTDENAQGTTGTTRVCSASLTRTWYHTGRENDEDITSEAPALWMPWQPGKTRLTMPESETQYDADWTAGAGQALVTQRLHRALQGQMLRQEVYGLDDSPQSHIPYYVTLSRYQVRLLQAAYSDQEPVVLPLLIETLGYYYERVAADPRISHQVQLKFDAFGHVVHSVDIAYPRRARAELSAWPTTLPEGGFDATFDDQQTRVSIYETRSQARHLTDPQAWCIGLPELSRQNALQYPASVIPVGGFSQQRLLQADSVLSADKPRVFAGQTRIVYADHFPPVAGLIDYTESAELDESCLKAFDGVLTRDELEKKLLEAGYLQVEKQLGPQAESDKIWVARRGYTPSRYDLNGFYLPTSTRPTLLVGATEMNWDSYFCVVISVTDAAKLVTSAKYDYRFMSPWQVTDINNNNAEVLFDALGRVVATSFYGTEEGKATGFKPVSTFTVPTETLAQLLDKPDDKQDVACYILTEPFSWMGKLEPSGFETSEWRSLLEQRLLTPEGYIRKAARIRAAATGLNKQTAEKIQATEQIPIHGAIFTADQYPDRPQQVRIGVAFYDGFSRTLQTSQRHPAGEAWLRDNNGALKVADGKLVTDSSNNRWAISGRVEYNNKGLPVRVYQPYFVDNWRYVKDESLLVHGYADTHFYDPPGREVKVLTAKGYLRRQGYYPWFTVSEDENDTLE